MVFLYSCIFIDLGRDSVVSFFLFNLLLCTGGSLMIFVFMCTYTHAEKHTHRGSHSYRKVLTTLTQQNSSQVEVN